MILKSFRPALVMLALFTLLTGMIYPAAVTALAQFFFPQQANGSLIIKNGVTVGSNLIGQQFSDPKYFWGRPSATSPAYNGAASSGSNLGPLNPVLLDAVKERVKQLRAFDSLDTRQIPVDLVTSSGSGLDPHISVAAALYQVHRVATARGITEAEVLSLVDHSTQGRQWGFLGEPRVNVLQLNLALDGLHNQQEHL